MVSLTLPYQHVDAHSYLFEATVTKLEKTALTQFIEGIFANIIVNIGVFTFLRIKDDAGRAHFRYFHHLYLCFLGI